MLQASPCRQSPVLARSHIDPVTCEQIAVLLEGYAARGVFRGFSCGVPVAGRETFKMLWHRDQQFQLEVNMQAKTLRFPLVLPQVPAKSSMYREFRQFVTEQQAEGRLEHRRIDPAKVKIACSNRAGNVGLTITAIDGDLEYSIRKLIGLVQEIYMVFLYDGRYYDYMIEIFDLDPDHM